MDVLYEDNHLLIVNKAVGEIVQGDKTGDRTLADEAKNYIKERYAKPGNVFIGVTHRLDRPVSGVVVLARTSKALARMDELFRSHEKVRKIYWAITSGTPPRTADTLKCHLLRNERQNKSYIVREGTRGAKEASLSYRLLARADRYNLLEVELHTGRHHQIRCQLADMGCVIRGDLKYGAPRSNPDGGISLHARSISFRHPVSGKNLAIVAPTPHDALWDTFLKILSRRDYVSED